MQAIDPTTRWHLATEQNREQVRTAHPLLEAAARLVERLPDAPLHLLTRNSESAAVVGAALALHDSRAEPASWQPVTLSRPERLPGTGRLVFVEVAKLGQGLRMMLTDRYPGVEIIDQLALETRDESGLFEQAA
jgi:hypothetical protein